MRNYAAQCFSKQAFGKEPWPAKYPFQRSPFLNIAGAVQDLSHSPWVSPDRFVNRPALVASGSLLSAVNSASISASPNRASINVNNPHAQLMNDGGESPPIPISRETRRNAAAWLRNNREYRDKLGPILNRPFLVTQVTSRPFMDMNQELMDLIRARIEQYIKEESV